MKKNVRSKIQKLYTDWRSKSHQHYKKVGRGHQAKRNPPDHFVDRIQDWVWLCDNIFENKKWKASYSNFFRFVSEQKYNDKINC